MERIFTLSRMRNDGRDSWNRAQHKEITAINQVFSLVCSDIAIPGQLPLDKAFVNMFY